MDETKNLITEFSDYCTVLTGFIGFDINLGEGEPAWWDSYVMEGPLGGLWWTYATKEEALAGHEAMVGLVRQFISWEQQLAEDLAA